MNSELKGRRPERWKALIAKANNRLPWCFLGVVGSLREPLMIFSCHFMHIHSYSCWVNEYIVRRKPDLSNVTVIQYPFWCSRVKYGMFSRLPLPNTHLCTISFSLGILKDYSKQGIGKPWVPAVAYEFESV